jgi:hypothetical protein
VHPLLVEVREIVGAVGVALAHERHVEQSWLGQRVVDARVRGELDPQRLCIDGFEGGEGGAFGHDTRVEMRCDVAHQVELVHVVAREVDRRDAAAFDLVDGRGIDDGAVEVAEEEVDVPFAECFAIGGK